MKQIIILCALIFTSCRSQNSDWDSGASRQESYQQERMEESAEDSRDQNPKIQPF